MPARGNALVEVFAAFLKLGLTSFGGPIAHIGYFRREFVERRRWLPAAEFAELVALCQSLPGPSSSQLGFAIGQRRGGWFGAMAAFVGFTTPSAVLLFAFAGLSWGSSNSIEWAILDGLKLAAVAVVSHALLQMARAVNDTLRFLSIAVAVVTMLALVDAAWMQLVIIGVGAVVGAMLAPGRPDPRDLQPAAQRGPAVALVAITLFIVGWVAAVRWTSTVASPTSIFAAFWSAGSLVFGGGHVVLPLLHTTVVGPDWIPSEVFVTGYGAAQAVPGPLFSIAAFLGAAIRTDYSSVMGAFVATFAIFAPGFLLLSAALPVWSRLTTLPRARGAFAGINAAVVGLLAAALYDPVMLTGILTWTDALIAVIGVAILWNERRPAILAVGWCVGAAVLLQAF